MCGGRKGHRDCSHDEMRKRFKLKRRSCPMCKPSKMGWQKRWSVKDEDKLRRFEIERQDLIK